MSSIISGFNFAAFERRGIEVSNKATPAETTQYMRDQQAAAAKLGKAAPLENNTRAGTLAGQNMPVSLSMLIAHEVDSGAVEQNAESETTKYDFSKMTRGEIEEAGKKLFSEGKITLDDLFQFQHPDGRLRVGPNGGMVEFDPDETIDFIAATRQHIKNMEETGEARRADSGYKQRVELLDKLIQLSA